MALKWKVGVGDARGGSASLHVRNSGFPEPHKVEYGVGVNWDAEQTLE